MFTRYIGDIHGKIEQYYSIIQCEHPTIQVGDFGYGFKPMPEFHLKDRFIRGNHDSPEICKTIPNYIPDGSFDNETMFVGGALSIDKHYRIEGVSWWRDEELSYSELVSIIDNYAAYNPEIMVTHECPESIAGILMGNSKLNIPSITRNAFENMFQLHQPKLWIFGHWHQSFNQVVNNTRFICLNELEYIDI